MDENDHIPSVAERVFILLATIAAGLLIVGGLISGMVSSVLEFFGELLDRFPG